ncbi:MAG TPA: glycosyltransferase, partial [Vicinamibacteria bacterium]
MTVAWGVLLAASATSFVVLVFLVGGLARMTRWLPRLGRAAPESRGDRPWPLVTIVVPARNEAAAVEAAVRSLLAQDYPRHEVFAVDDRSTDSTGAILDHLADEDPRLRVIHVSTLPQGWLGKNHACQLAGAEARGDWLLFTDGDVSFAPETLRRAIAVAEERGLGHLVAFPEMVAPGFLERAFVTAFGLLLSLKCRSWDLGRSATSGYVGFGAFNLVRREAWERIGGHRRLAFEVLDDLKLGLILRRSGVRQGVAEAFGLVRVRWQRGFRSSLGGLMKNAFAGTEWSWRQALSLAATLALLGLGPVVSLLLWSPPPGGRELAAAALGGWMLVHGITARKMAGGTGFEGLLFPGAVLALVGVLLASALRASITGGITWRDTRYPLDA